MLEFLRNNLDLFLIIIILNLIFLIFFKKLSKIYSLFDYPDNHRKIHKEPVSLMGGFIIFLSFFLSIVYVYLFKDQKIIQENLYVYSIQSVIIFLFVLSSIFVLGIFDDKFFLHPLKKLLSLIFLITIMCLNDSTTLISYFKIPIENLTIPFSQLSLIFSVSCYVFLIISLNMFDGINLQSFLFYFINFFFLLFDNNYVMSLLFVILISLLVFSYFNFKNLVFLGDNGTYILALILGYLFVKIHNNTDIYNSIDILNFLFLPIIDSARVIFDRQIKNKAVFLPDNTHIHHNLLKKYNYRKSILILSFMILLPHILYQLDVNSFLTLFFQFIIYFYILKKK